MYALLGMVDHEQPGVPVAVTRHWKILHESDSLFQVVLERERHLQTWGHETKIIEIIDPLLAYRRADYERDEQEKQAKRDAG